MKGGSIGKMKKYKESQLGNLRMEELKSKVMGSIRDK